MIEFNCITGFDWDHGNERKSSDKHGVTKAEAEQIFFNIPLLLTDDNSHSQFELRIHALGITDARRKLHITFTLRHDNTKIRIISARDMSRKERRHYEQQT